MKTTSKIISISQIQTNTAFPTTLPLKDKIKVSDIPVLVCQKNTKIGRINLISYEMISGHARLQAAKDAGLKEISCLIVDESPELIEKLQRLDWAHTFGEHGILKHPDAYAHYKKLKSEYLKRKLSPELETQEAWKTAIDNALQHVIKSILTNSIGENHIGFIDALMVKLNSVDELTIALNVISDKIADQHFKLNDIEKQGYNLIKIISNSLIKLSEQPTEWANLAPLDLPLPSEPIEFNPDEIFEIFNEIPNIKAIYQRHTNHALNINKNGLITASNCFYKSIANYRKLKNDDNNTFNDIFLQNLMMAIQANKGAAISSLYTNQEYEVGCQMDFTLRLNTVLTKNYSHLKFNARKFALTRERIGNVFDKNNTIASLFDPTSIKKAELEELQANSDMLKTIFVEKIESTISDNNKIVQIMLACVQKLSEDEDTIKFSIKALKKQLKQIRTNSIAEYAHADSDKFDINNTAELLGFLLFMQRSYKHFAKNKIAEQNVFLKRKLSFSIISDYLSQENHRLVTVDDGITDFSFMLKLANLGAVTTQLKISTYGKCDYFVDTLGSYRAKINNTEVSDLHHTAKSIIHKNLHLFDNDLSDDMIDQTISQWMDCILRLKKPDIDHLPLNTQQNIIRLLRHHVFTMFYIEGLRNPAAFVIHPKLLQELISEPLEELNNYIVNGNFIMTPVGSKSEGEMLHRFFQPPSIIALNKAMKVFECKDNNMAERSLAALGNIDSAQILRQFNLRSK